jgi:hypothetical protein
VITPRPGGMLRRSGRGAIVLTRLEADATLAFVIHKCTKAFPHAGRTTFGALRRGSGDRANVTLGGRLERRAYAGANLCLGTPSGDPLPEPFQRLIRCRSLETPRGDQGKGCALDQLSFFANRARPTSDSIYLASRIDEAWGSHRLTPAALQILADRYGDRALEDKLRELYGFPPGDAIRSAYAYLETMLREGL